MSTFKQLLIKEGGRCGDKGVPECLFSCDWLFVSPWTVAHQAPLSMEFSRKDWNGLPFSPSGDLPNPGIEPASPALQADSLPLSLGLLSEHFLSCLLLCFRNNYIH